MTIEVPPNMVPKFEATLKDLAEALGTQVDGDLRRMLEATVLTRGLRAMRDEATGTIAFVEQMGWNVGRAGAAK